MSTAVVVRRAGFDGLLRSEWTKLRTVRSTTWSLVGMAGVSVGLMSFIVWVIMRQWSTFSPDEQAMLAAEPLQIIIDQPVFISQLIVAVLGVMVVSAEYTTGMIRSTLQAQPRRLPVLLAKVTVFAALMFVVGELLSFAAFFAGRWLMSSHITVNLGDPGIARSVFGAGLFITVLGLFSLAFGAIVRHTAGAITGVLGLILIVSNLTALLPGTWGARVHAWMPTNAGQLVFKPTLPPDSLLTQWQGLAVFAAWTTLLLATAAYLFKTRDA
jgi:ABC-type transport system involved in multi-copper enzyme maturation permease subunit